MALYKVRIIIIIIIITNQTWACSTLNERAQQADYECDTNIDWGLPKGQRSSNF